MSTEPVTPPTHLPADALPDLPMTRDPRVDPQPGDRLDVIGWKIDVVCVTDVVDYWLRGGPAVAPGLITRSLASWQAEMLKHASIVHVAPTPEPSR